MTITHIVLFKYNEEGTKLKSEIRQKFSALKTACVDAQTNEPYILDFVGGSQNSPEGLTRGVDDIFVVTFPSSKERDYYVDEDPAHGEFKKWVVQYVDLSEGTSIHDFEGGEYK